MGPALNFDISAGSLTLNNLQQDGERGIEILHRAVALAAMHDSAESFPQPKCHPETRTKMLEDLRTWAMDRHGKPTILWLHGPAGAGKSAIMQTLADELRDGGVLGGCFFFKRGHATRGNAKTLFATIAYQLALSVSWLRTSICEIVENDPSIVGRSVGIQMQNLISEPCSPHRNRDPVAIIIDGLDECEGHNVQREILRVIRQTSSDHTIPLRFFIASRPEPHIREMLESPFYSGHYRSFDVEKSFRDVFKYLSDEFARIHREHDTMRNIPRPWPSPDVLDNLVEKSSGHFIYASTIIKFIDDKNYRPMQRLAVVQDAKSTDSESAFEALDQLYLIILNFAPRQSELIPILCAVVNFQLDVDGIDELFGLPVGETRLVLRSLHSVLRVPQEERISSHHASFLDFLDNPNRSRNFCVGTVKCRFDLARSCLQHMTRPCSEIKWWETQQINDFIKIIVSLPLSAEVAELFPLIGSIDPEYVFHESYNNDWGHLISWLRKLPSAPQDLITLWEDYAYMLAIQRALRSKVWLGSQAMIKHMSPELLRILVPLTLLPATWLSQLCGPLSLTWTELRTSFCRPCSVGCDEDGLPALDPRWACRDAALRYIRTMVQNHSGADSEKYWRGYWISYLVRSSPACRILYCELWSINPVSLWFTDASAELLIHHVSKWLQSFPQPKMDLIAYWELGRTPNPYEDCTHSKVHLERAEDEWSDIVNCWDNQVLKLHGLHRPLAS
ncbi:hypothetical protein C8R45DRAFT_991657 [Mycena sanguinolenta]|nr:hypothetical protein C8R45DRAFT_991657 [Mycena sanguinolenta]